MTLLPSVDLKSLWLCHSHPTCSCHPRPPQITRPPVEAQSTLITRGRGVGTEDLGPLWKTCSGERRQMRFLLSSAGECSGSCTPEHAACVLCTLTHTPLAASREYTACTILAAQTATLYPLLATYAACMPGSRAPDPLLGAQYPAPAREYSNL